MDVQAGMDTEFLPSYDAESKTNTFFLAPEKKIEECVGRKEHLL